ncbi:MAG TPA: DMT family transporter [Pseudonocardiaceae bacterium]|nr:DMT family transporter [Pseudonocardiaceae bacterium]
MAGNPRSAVIGGVAGGAGAGLIWGVSFPIPEMLVGWSPVAITAGRYLVYGGLSLVLFLFGGRALRALGRRHWRLVLVYAITGNVGYYLMLVLGIDLVGAPVTDIIIGCTPVFMAIAGNLLYPAYSWRSLALPLILVSVGLAVVNILEIGGADPTEQNTTTMKVLGVLAASTGALVWTWYGLANAKFLSSHPEISPVAWATLIGVSTGVVTIVAMPLAAATGHLSPNTPPGGEHAGLAAFVLGSLVLGVMVSWVGAGLWNLASARISPTAVGMLLNVETAAGFTYVYLARADWPPLGQVAGLVLVLLGVMLVVRQTTAAAPELELPPLDAPAGVTRQSAP